MTRQLRLFERHKLIERQIFAEVPPRVEYRITDLGRTLGPTLDSLAQWMRTHGQSLDRKEDAAIS